MLTTGNLTSLASHDRPIGAGLGRTSPVAVGRRSIPVRRSLLALGVDLSRDLDPTAHSGGPQTAPALQVGDGEEDETTGPTASFSGGLDGLGLDNTSITH